MILVGTESSIFSSLGLELTLKFSTQKSQNPGPTQREGVLGGCVCCMSQNANDLDVPCCWLWIRQIYVFQYRQQAQRQSAQQLVAGYLHPCATPVTRAPAGLRNMALTQVYMVLYCNRSSVFSLTRLLRIFFSRPSLNALRATGFLR